MTLPPVLDDAGRPLDQIRLTGLTVRGHHGVFAHERRDGQDFVVDVVLHLDTRAAASSDDLADTVDYGGLAEDLAAVVGGEPLDLIEALAARLADVALRDGRVQAADVTVHKPAAPIPLSFQDVSVSVRRRREPATSVPGRHHRRARAVLALGANLGDRRAALQSAVDALARTGGISVLAVSALVETAPVGGPEQPDYLNAVAVVDTTLPPRELLAACQRIEAEHGRERAVRWGPRTLDIDIVDYAGVRSEAPDLTLPHPRAAGRAFVLVPWLSVAPDATLPDADGVPVPLRELLARAADADGVRPTDANPLEVPE